MDISMLRDRGNRQTLTVSELNDYIKNIFDLDRTLSAVSIKGEISNLTNHRSGHLYFTLKDENAQIKAVMFRSSAQNLKFAPENGMKVIVFGYVSVYQRDGVFQMYANTMQPDGVGALYRAYEQLKEKLSVEGLFDDMYKKTIPDYPDRIGIITSSTGAAVRDIINVTNRRYPIAKIYIYPSLVQGDGAESNLIKALDYFAETKLVDVIIIGRGGGSIEDLWAFNSEKLARKIFSMDIPIISAVGHETDFTICDFVADLRAPTPSAAAELSVPDSAGLLLRLDAISDKINDILIYYINSKKERLESLKKSEVILSPQILFDDLRFRITEGSRILKQAMKALIDNKRFSLALNTEKTNVLNPLSVISRGYAIVQNSDTIVKDINQIRRGDMIDIRLNSGIVTACVEKVTKRKGKE